MPPLEPEIFRVILESLATGIYVVDRDRKIIVWNDGAEKISGHLRQEVLGRNCQDDILALCDENDVILSGESCPMAETLRDGVPREVNVFLRHKEGQRIPMRVRAVPVRNADGLIIGAAGSFDERALPDPHLLVHDSAVHGLLDSATGLPDDASIRLRLDEHLRYYTEDHIPFGVLSIAVDHLDEYRRNRGKTAADAMLLVTARTLVKTLRPTDLVGCRSGDRFLAIAVHCPAAAVVRVAELLRKMAGLVTVSWWGDPVPVTISVGGTAVGPGDAADSILGRSEEALCASLAGGGNCVTIV